MAGKQKGSRKVGRHKKKGHNLRYINENRHEKSHIRRLTKHLTRFPDDAVAAKALTEYKIRAGIPYNR